jgi:PKD repeat protein
MAIALKDGWTESNICDSTRIPVASFTYPSGTLYTETDLTFDASASTDDDTEANLLQVRWDWENDGTWETEWTTTKTAIHPYEAAGIVTIKLAVKDSFGVEGYATSVLTIAVKPLYYFTSSFEMVNVEGGTFIRTAGTISQQVTLSDFAIGKYEVTLGQYDMFCIDTGSRSLVSDSGWGRGTRPAIKISWYDAVDFCNWLSGKEGLQAAYTGSGTNWNLDRTKDGYRLPTEAE